MSNVFDILRADHREVEQMLATLEGGPAQGDRAGPVRPEARKQLTEKLIIESSKHEAAEEQYFWPVVRDRLPDGDQLADHAIDQETDAKQVLARLEKLSPGQAEFPELLSRYIPAAREHMAYEEEVVWPALQEVLTAAEAENLGKDITIAKEIAPTRPHPHIPPQPAVLKTAGPAVAAADKVRDELSGRGDS
jgi:hemerythrin-like domain-containing protein